MGASRDGDGTVLTDDPRIHADLELRSQWIATLDEHEQSRLVHLPLAEVEHEFAAWCRRRAGRRRRQA